MEQKITQLYQAQLLAEHKTPVGFELDITKDYLAHGDNPACGDHIEVAINGEDKIQAIAFYGDSCAICRASASLMCQTLVTFSTSQAQEKITQVVAGLNQQIPFIDNLVSLNAVYAFPIRVQCALLPWQTALRALTDNES